MDTPLPPDPSSGVPGPQLVPPLPPPPPPGWLQKTAAVVWVIFCFEIGVFLMVFPWLDFWEHNLFSNLGYSQFSQYWEAVWDSHWFRGAVSGLGLVNLLISIIEVFQLRRLSPPPEPPAGHPEP